MARKPVKKRATRKLSAGRRIIESAKTESGKLKSAFDAESERRREQAVRADQFYIDPKTVPKGKAYQWVVTHIHGEHYPELVKRAKGNGWKPVPGFKPVGGQILMWAPRKLADAQIAEDVNRAKEQLRYMTDSLRMTVPTNGKPLPHRKIPEIKTASFVVSREYKSVPKDAPPIDVEINLKFRISRNWQDAAASLNLEPQEYARRRILMTRPVLGTQSAHLDAVYEPIELSFNRKED